MNRRIRISVGILSALVVFCALFIFVQPLPAMAQDDELNSLEGTLISGVPLHGGTMIEDATGQRYCLVGKSATVRRHLEAWDSEAFTRQAAAKYSGQGAADSHQIQIDPLIVHVEGEMLRFRNCVVPRTGDKLPVFRVETLSVLGEPHSEVRKLSALDFADVADAELSSRPRGVALAIQTKIACENRTPRDLLPLLTKEFGISADYEPNDLTPLADHAPSALRISNTILVRRVIVRPLVEMLADMQELGLRPLIYSAYRSYRIQAATYRRWTQLNPRRGPFISAPAGHSEHQLGTTLDFGSSELSKFTGSQVRFHPAFSKTREGAWLQENAHEYGFTLSYPDGATEITGYYFEPWHYRYVGVEVATHLHTQGIPFTEYMSSVVPEPCTP